MNQMLMVLELLAAASSDKSMRAAAKKRGWDASAAGITETVVLHRLKDRMDTPTSGGWADTMVCFSLDSDEAGHVCEVWTIAPASPSTVRCRWSGPCLVWLRSITCPCFGTLVACMRAVQ